MFASLQGEVSLYAELMKYSYLPKRPKAKKPSPKSRNILNAICAFDIETSTIILPSEDDGGINAHAFMYVWQFQINDKTFMGRTWDDFIIFLSMLTDAIEETRKFFKLTEKPQLIIWVHNLAYEFQWLSGLYHFSNEECFFRDFRKPIYCRMFECLEFRCSYIQTNMSLRQLTKQLGVEEKLSGQKYDYEKLRFPWTELSEYEKEYCVRDVRSLVECMKVKMDQDGDTLQTIPLTSTGYVRRDCVRALKDQYLFIKDLLPNIDQYKLLRKAFRGGNTHANKRYSGKILKDVYSYDMSSCYPAQQLTKDFPMTPFRWIDYDITLERVMKFIGLNYAVVGLYQFKGLRLKRKDEPIPYLSLARVDCYGFKVDNGRVLECEYIEIAMTEIDLAIVLDQYNYDEIDIKTAMVAQKKPLPEEYRNVIRQYYDHKTKLKPPKGQPAPYIYHKDKEKLNGIYGMSAQDPIHAEILYNDGDYTRSDYSSSDAALKLQKARFPYQWGVYTTAYARLALQQAIKMAGKQMVYCDTDSVKTLGKMDLTELNTKRQKVAERNGAYSDDTSGIRHYVGVFELDGHYDRFITCGAKRYAYEADGHMSITVSGVSTAVNEETGKTFAAEELGCLENFKEGFIWHKSAGTMAIYNDHDDFDYTDPESGNTVHISKNVALVPTTYQMTYANDYRLLLREIDLYGEYKSARE